MDLKRTDAKQQNENENVNRLTFVNNYTMDTRSITNVFERYNL